MKTLLLVITLVLGLVSLPCVAETECFFVCDVEKPGPNFAIFLNELKRSLTTCNWVDADYIVEWEFPRLGIFRVNIIDLFDKGDPNRGEYRNCYTLGSFTLLHGERAKQLAHTIAERLEGSSGEAWKNDACPEEGPEN